MKKFFSNALGVSVLFTLVFLVSCSKSSGPGSVWTDPVTPPSSASITATTPASPAFNATNGPGTAQIPYIASGSAIAKMRIDGADQGAALSGIFLVSNLTTSRFVKFEALDGKGTVIASQDVYVQVYSPEMTLMCYRSPGTDGHFDMVGLKINDISITSIPCDPNIFSLDGSSLLLPCTPGGNASPGQWVFLNQGLRFNGLTYDTFTVIDAKTFEVGYNNGATPSQRVVKTYRKA